MHNIYLLWKVSYFGGCRSQTLWDVSTNENYLTEKAKISNNWGRVQTGVDHNKTSDHLWIEEKRDEGV